MKNKFVDYAIGTAVGIAIAMSPGSGEAFYVSQKEMNKAGIKASQITKTKHPMGDKFSYKGHVEDDETFDIIVERIKNEAEDFFGTNLSYRTTRKVLEDFNSYRNVEMPLVSVPCKYQFMANYVRELEKEMERHGKPGPMEKDLEFLKGKLGELEELYEHDITELREKYTAHEKRIKELEKRPGQKDYSGEIDELWKENEELREMLESMGGGYAQPPVAESYGSTVGSTVIIGQPEWFPSIPYPYRMLGESIYCWNGFGWMYWGIFEGYGHGFRGRRWDGRIFDYYGPKDLPLHEGRMGRRGLLDGKRLGNREKDIDSRGRGHERGHLPDLHDRRFEGKPRNDGRFEHRGFQKGETPKMHEDRRNRTMGRENIPRQEYKGNFQGGNSPRSQYPNQQFNRGMQNRGPQGFSGGGNSHNFQGSPQRVNPGRSFGQGGATGQHRSGGRGKN